MKPYHLHLHCGHWLRDLGATEAEPIRTGAVVTCPHCGTITSASGNVKLGGLSGRQSRRLLAERDANRAVRSVELFARPVDKDFT